MCFNTVAFEFSHLDLCFQCHGKITQLTFTCSKPTIETLEKGVKYVQSNNNC